jgi:hypothetical protein
VSSLQGWKIDLPHREHCLPDTRRTVRVRILQQLPESPRDDLPRQAEAVLEPAALPRLAAFGEPSPQVVNFDLFVAGDEEREIASVNRKCGPPLIARNSCPWMRNVAEKTRLVSASPVRLTSTISESSKIDV